MAKKNLLLVDSDAKSLRMLEISLRKAGFSLTTAVSAADARAKIELSAPDLILVETRLPDMSGLDLVAELKTQRRTENIPMIFLSSEDSLDLKVRGLELGVEDYLTKPIYLKEVLTRVRILLEKLEKEKVERRDRSATFSGFLGEMGLVDLVQTIEIGRKTGTITIDTGRHKGEIAFTDGKVVDAHTGRLSGERAFYRMLVWNEGVFNMEFGPHGESDVIELSTQGLLMEGMRRVDEWGRLLEQLPPLERVFEIDYTELVDRLAEIPDEINGILRLFDGHRSLLDVVDESDFGDLEALEIASKLYFEGLIYDVATREDASMAPREEPIQQWLDDEPALDDHAAVEKSEPHPVAPAVPYEPFTLAPPADAEAELDPDTIEIPPDDDEVWDEVAAAAAGPADTQIDMAPPAVDDQSTGALAEELGLSKDEVAYALSDEGAPVDDEAPATAVDASTLVKDPPPAPEGTLEEELAAALPDAEVPVPADDLSPAAGEVMFDEVLSTPAVDNDLAPPPGPTTPARPSAFDGDDSDLADAFADSFDVPEEDTPVSHVRVISAADAASQIEFDTYEEEAAPSPLWRRAAALTLTVLVAALVFYLGARLLKADNGDDPVAIGPEPSAAPPADTGTDPTGTAVAGAPDAGPKVALADPPPGDGDGPATTDPATSDKPTSTKPTTDKPTSTKPTSTKPTADKPASGKPATTKPASDKPATTKPDDGDKPARDPEADKKKQFASALRKATKLSDKGKFTKAIKAYKEALRLKGDSAAAHLGIGNTYYELNSLDAALVHLERARALNPRDPQVYVLLGAVYQSAAKRSKAIEAYEKYLELAPNGRFARELKNVLASLKARGG